MKKEDIKLLRSDLEDVLPGYADRVLEIVIGDTDPYDYDKVLAAASSSMFVLRPWRLAIMAISTLLDTDITYHVDNVEGGVVATVHLRGKQYLCYHSLHDSFKVLASPNLTGAAWYG